MAITKEQFKNAMAEYPSGVTVITYKLENEMSGLTVSSFCSLSMEPPLVLFNLSKNSSQHDKLIKSGAFAVNILNSGAEDISQRFALPETNKHTTIEKIGFTVKETGSPMLMGCLVILDCQLDKVYDGGDHSIIIGKILYSSINEGMRPLIYYKRKYYTI